MSTNKEFVSKAQEILKEKGIEVKTSQLYEVFSQLAGFKDWNVAKTRKVEFKNLVTPFDDIPESWKYIINNLKEIKGKNFVGFDENKEPILTKELITSNIVPNCGTRNNLLPLIISLLNLQEDALFLMGDIDSKLPLLMNSYRGEAYRGTPENVSFISPEKEDFFLVIREVLREVESRRSLMDKQGVSNIEDLEKIVGRKFTKIFLYLEDYQISTSLFSNEEELDGNEILDRQAVFALITSCRNTGIQFAFQTSKPSVSGVKPEFREMMNKMKPVESQTMNFEIKKPELVVAYPAYNQSDECLIELFSIINQRIKLNNTNSYLTNDVLNKLREIGVLF